MTNVLMVNASLVKRGNKKAAEAAFLYEIQELTSDLDFRTEIAEFLTEFIHTSCCINDLVLTGVERMRCGRNFDFH
jgi:site-specific recombinase